VCICMLKSSIYVLFISKMKTLFALVHIRLALYHPAKSIFLTLSSQSLPFPFLFQFIFSDSKLAALYASAPSKTADLKRRYGTDKYTSDASQFKDVSVEASSKSQQAVSPVSVERTLQSYNHNPRKENPLYATTTNEFGMKKPTVATYTADRVARDQKFSNAFNSMMPRDQGLNTSLTRSNVHVELDPQFI
jgi:hypothetical protein